MRTPEAKYDARARARTRALPGASLALLLLGACTGHDAAPSGTRASDGGPPVGAACDEGRLPCGGACVDPATDAENCGGCGQACPRGLACAAGACRASGTAPACASGTCTCAGGTTLCGTVCVDTKTNGANCGACGTACTGGTSCVAGVCQCPSRLALCDGACADTSRDARHCGACGNACGSGATCENGACTCSNGGTSCAGACVDTSRDDNHCGGCNNACTGGAVCTGGACACPGTEVLCNGTCVDTTTSLTDCGGCGNACASNEVCTEGRCEGPLAADGCSGSARGLTITAVAVYQSIKVPLMTDGQPVDGSARGADVIQGRDAMFRVFSTLDTGFLARELSARLTVTNGTAEDQYFAKRTVAGDSNEADLGSTFDIVVPKDRIQADTRWSVEVVECGAGSGAIEVPRYPVSGDVALAARKTGPLKITVVPVETNGHSPDTSDAALSVYRGLMTAMYPADDVQIAVGSGITTSYPVDWTGLLDQIRAKRQSDNPPADVYYYGFLKPTDTLVQYCQSSCTAGIGYVVGPGETATRAAVGLAFADESSAKTMAHEIGHNHGRNHAPCAPGPISGVDASYPYPGGLTFVWGYDSRNRVLFDPGVSTDIMGYCSNKWISDYTYRGITDRVATVNGAFEVLTAPSAVQAFRVLLVDARGPRWGVPFDGPRSAYGTAELADVLDAGGNVVTRITVYRTEVADANASSVLVPPPEAGWFAVRVAGATPVRFPAPAQVPQ